MFFSTGCILTRESTQHGYQCWHFVQSACHDARPFYVYICSKAMNSSVQIARSVRILSQGTRAHPHESRLTFAWTIVTAESALDRRDAVDRCRFRRSRRPPRGSLSVCPFFSENPGNIKDRRREAPAVSAFAPSLIHRTFIDDESSSFVHKSWYYKPKLSWM